MSKREREMHSHQETPNLKRTGTMITDVRRIFAMFALKSYAIWMKVPPLRYYVLKIRSRLALIHQFHEFELRRQTMKFAYLTVGTLSITITILMLLNPSWFFFLTLLIACAVIQGVMLDGYVNRQEKKLLEQMLDFFAAVRHAYHRHGMVADAIDEAGEQIGREVGVHANLIFEAITHVQPNEALEKYYETAPNRFLKAFAGISRLVMEYGDRKRAQGSLYLRGISSLTGEIQLELIRKNKLDYFLKGLHLIALTPVFFTKPIELWARNNFPLMDQFYLSKAGMVIKISIFFIILIAYLLLQKLRSEEETMYRAGKNRLPWEAYVYDLKFAGAVCQWFVPAPSSEEHYRISRLLRETNHSLRLEWFQVRRISVFLTCLIFTLGTCVTMHYVSQQRILEEPPSQSIFFGKLPEDEAKAAREGAVSDAKVMRHFHLSSGVSYDDIAESLITVLSEGGKSPSSEEINMTAHRILDKLNRWNSEYLTWWEVLLALIIGAIGYYVPLWTLMFQRKMRLMDMRHEVYQFQTMISILRELERISVEEILDWLTTYAVIFKLPLQKCLLDFDHSAEAALQQLKQEAPLDEFQRMTDKLLLAAEKISIADAFDDLDGEMSYHFERRRLDYEKSIDTKAGLGRLIGFTPMYSLIFAYLVIPLIWMSFQQMGFYFEQIQKL